VTIEIRHTEVTLRMLRLKLNAISLWLVQPTEVGWSHMVTVTDVTHLNKLFGEDAPLAPQDFRARIAAGISRGVEVAGDAYEFSIPYSDGHTYGTNRWRFVLSEIAVAFQDVAGVKPLATGGLQVPIVPVGGGRSLIVYPLCFANDAVTDPQFARVRTSRLRQLLFFTTDSNSGYVQDVLFPESGRLPATIPSWVRDEVDEAVAEDEAALREAEAVLATSPLAFRTLIVGYASNHSAGLLRLIVGEAGIASDGTLTFSWLEDLPVLGPDGPTLRLADDDRLVSFDQAPEPSLDVYALPTESTGEDADA
jgi:hypothetical protein